MMVVKEEGEEADTLLEEEVCDAQAAEAIRILRKAGVDFTTADVQNRTILHEMVRLDRCAVVFLAHHPCCMRGTKACVLLTKSRVPAHHPCMLRAWPKGRALC